MNLIIIPVQTPNFCSSRSPPSWPSRAWWPAGPAHPRATRSPPLLGPAKICPGVPVFGTCTAPTLGAGPKTKFWPSLCPTIQLSPAGPAYRPPTGMRMVPAAQPHRICPRCWCFWHLHCVLHLVRAPKLSFGQAFAPPPSFPWWAPLTGHQRACEWPRPPSPTEFAPVAGVFGTCTVFCTPQAACVGGCPLPHVVAWLLCGGPITLPRPAGATFIAFEW